MIAATNIKKCHDGIKFTITDKGGHLQFTKFEIADEEICNGVENTLRSYLLNCPLADINIDAIRHALSGRHEECARAIADIIKWFCPNQQ